MTKPEASLQDYRNAIPVDPINSARWQVVSPSGAYLSVSDVWLEMAEGAITGHSGLNKFGASPEIAADTQEDIWDGQGTLPLPDFGDALMTRIWQVVDQLNLRGALCIVEGLDITGAYIAQNAYLDTTLTTTPVILATPLWRCFRVNIKAIEASSSIIKITNTAGNVIYAAVSTGNNQTLMAAYTVPLGFSLYITGYYGSHHRVTNKDPLGVGFKLWIKENGFFWQLKHADATSQSTAKTWHGFKPYLEVTELHDIKMTGQPTNDPVHCHAGFDGILVAAGYHHHD